jgi:hypothetical protein
MFVGFAKSPMNVYDTEPDVALGRMFISYATSLMNISYIYSLVM